MQHTIIVHERHGTGYLAEISHGFIYIKSVMFFNKLIQRTAPAILHRIIICIVPFEQFKHLDNMRMFHSAQVHCLTGELTLIIGIHVTATACYSGIGTGIKVFHEELLHSYSQIRFYLTQGTGHFHIGSGQIGNAEGTLT